LNKLVSVTIIMVNVLLKGNNFTSVAEAKTIRNMTDRILFKKRQSTK